jgi:hypothetical protein
MADRPSCSQDIACPALCLRRVEKNSRGGSEMGDWDVPSYDDDDDDFDRDDDTDSGDDDDKDGNW